MNILLSQCNKARIHGSARRSNQLRISCEPASDQKAVSNLFRCYWRCLIQAKQIPGQIMTWLWVLKRVCSVFATGCTPCGEITIHSCTHGMPLYWVEPLVFQSHHYLLWLAISLQGLSEYLIQHPLSDLSNWRCQESFVCIADVLSLSHDPLYSCEILTFRK